MPLALGVLFPYYVFLMWRRSPLRMKWVCLPVGKWLSLVISIFDSNAWECSSLWRFVHTCSSCFFCWLNQQYAWELMVQDNGHCGMLVVNGVVRKTCLPAVDMTAVLWILASFHPILVLRGYRVVVLVGRFHLISCASFWYLLILMMWNICRIFNGVLIPWLKLLPCFGRWRWRFCYCYDSSPFLLFAFPLTTPLSHQPHVQQHVYGSHGIVAPQSPAFWCLEYAGNSDACKSFESVTYTGRPATLLSLFPIIPQF